MCGAFGHLGVYSYLISYFIKIAFFSSTLKMEIEITALLWLENRMKYLAFHDKVISIIFLFIYFYKMFCTFFVNSVLGILKKMQIAK